MIAEREQGDVVFFDPDLPAKLTADVCEASRAVEADRFKAAITQHLKNLSILYGRNCQQRLA